MPRWSLPVLLSATAFGLYVPLSESGGADARRQVESVLAMLDLRSPGLRAPGSLASAKPVRLSTPAVPTAMVGAPQQRALGKIFPPEIASPIVDTEAFAPPFQPDILAAAVPPEPIPDGLAAIGPAGLGGGNSGIGGGGGGGTGGGAVPGGGGGDIGGEPSPTAPPVAAVPEPGTWLMMIIAFGLCGAMLRRGRSRHRVESRGRSCAPAS